jgi:peptide/nickel transport system substrate-binding protein
MHQPILKKSFLSSRIFPLYIFLCFVLTAFCGCSQPEEPESVKDIKNPKPAYGDAIVSGSIGEPSTLIALFASDFASHAVAGLIFDGLVRYDKDLTIIGDLAESYEISDDGLQITFHIRKNLKWHDGVEFTAEDVMFGYKTIIDEKTPSLYKEDYLQVKKAEVLDKYTFRVTYDKPFAPALSSWGSPIALPKHLLEGKDIAKTVFGRNPVGNGMYKFGEWEPGQKVVLEANPDYYQGMPYIWRYVWRIVPDRATIFMELKAGGIDTMELTPFQYTRQTDTVFFKKNFRKFTYPSFSYTYLGFNLKHPWFSQKKVRQAIAHAIDKEELVKGVRLGLARPATGPYVPDTWPYNPDVKRYDFNPDEARRLLEEAGWHDDNGDGVLEKEGRDFEFTILTHTGSSTAVAAASIIQWRLSKVGIKVNIRTIEWSTFVNEFLNKGRFETVLLAWGISLDPDQYDIWHSSKTGGKGLNYIDFKNEEVDRLLEEGRRTFDIEKRKKAYYRIQEILAEELPYIFLYVPKTLTIVHARFYGIEVTPLGIGYNFHKWYVPQELQKYTFEMIK